MEEKHREATYHDRHYLNGQLGECSLRMPQWQHCAVLCEHGGWSTAWRWTGRIGAADDVRACVMVSLTVLVRWWVQMKGYGFAKCGGENSWMRYEGGGCDARCWDPAAQPGAFICAQAHTESGVVPGKHSSPATGDESQPEARAILIALNSIWQRPGRCPHNSQKQLGCVRLEGRIWGPSSSPGRARLPARAPDEGARKRQARRQVGG